MRRSAHKRLAPLAAALAVMLVVGGAHEAAAQPLPIPDTGGTPSGATPAVLAKVGIDQNLGQQVPLDLEFKDSEGKTVHLGDYFRGKPVIVAMVYYECPMLCTLTLNGLTRAIRALPFDVGDEYEIVTVSFNPSEGPELAAKKKAGYIKEYGRDGAAPGWHFLTGDEKNIKPLADALGFHYQYVPEKKQYAHATAIMVLTPQGKIARYYYGIEYSARDLRLGLVEASDEKIGSAVDQLLLYCFHYDPASGSYSAYALAFVRLGGAVTLLLLIGFIAIWRIRERRRSTTGN